MITLSIEANGDIIWMVKPVDRWALMCDIYDLNKTVEHWLHF